MVWWMIILMILGIYVGGWFVTALAITQIGTIKRGCAVGCNLRMNPEWDRYYHTPKKVPKYVGAHAPECNKPHFELVKAEDAAGYAIAWPYLWFFAPLAFSEKKAHQRQERQFKAKARKENPLTKEKLAELDKVLENSNLTVSEDGKIVQLKELES